MASSDASIVARERPPVSSTELVHSASGARPRDYHSIERDVEAPPTAQPSGNAKCRCKYFQKGAWYEHIAYFCALGIASYAGVIIRIYLGKLAKWNGVPLFASLYAEIVGTAVMGVIISHKKLLQEKHKAVYQGIATGLCGSITTFSSWNSEAATVLLQANRSSVDNAERFVSWMTILILGGGMPIAALAFGKHLARLSRWSDGRLGDEEGREGLSRGCVIAETVSIVAAWLCCTVLVVALPFEFSRFDLMFSAVLAVAGTYVRWHLAPLNSVFSDFKLGTFVVNVLGSWILGSVLVVEDHFGPRLNTLGLAFLTGVATGFCGCLTTVSTFAVELTSLSLRGSYIYGLTSVVLAQLGLILIRGPFVLVRTLS